MLDLAVQYGADVAAVADEVMNVAERSRAEQHLIVGVLFDRQEPILSDAINAALDLD